MNKYKPFVDHNKLILDYDKNKTKLSEIIDILNINKISFNEINTYESDLKDVFKTLLKND